MVNNKKLTTIELKSDENPEKCIIWLHGLGADGNDFTPIAQELRLPSFMKVKFVFPNAPIMPVTINQGYAMPAWFDIYTTDINDRADTPGIQRSVDQINELIEDEISGGIAPANIMLAGFSQGAAIALTTGLLYPKHLGGIVALSGLLPNCDATIRRTLPANRQLPIFIGHGTTDQVVSPTLGQLAYEKLMAAGYPAVWHTYPMAHSVCGDEVNDISQWIQKIWG